MDLILGAICVLLLGYFFLLVFYLWNWDRTPTIMQGSEMQLSIIVPVRNEEDGINKCIDSILGQDYKGEFSIIVVDDHSEDTTRDIVRKYCSDESRVTLVSLGELDGKSKGKKAALTCGIEIAKGDVIVTTDGDCTYSSFWLTSLISAFDDDTVIVTGPVVYPSGNKIFEGFQSLDLLSLILATAAGIQSKMYFMGNGANLAFRASAFEAVNGYAGNEAYASGDDMFLIQKIVDYYGGNAISYAKLPYAAVHTKPSGTFRAFLTQRIRWASKNKALKGRRVFLLWIFVWFVNVSILTVVIVGLLGYWSLWFVALILYAKMMMEGIALYRVAKYYNMVGVLRWFPWSFFLNIIYVVVIGIMSVIGPSFEWKGRSKAPYKEA